MSIEDPKLKKIAEACKKEVWEVIKKHYTKYLEEWFAEELKRRKK